MPIVASEARKRANKKWKDKSVYRVSVDLHKEKYSEVIKRLESCDSKSQYIKDALTEKVKREQEN